MFNAMIGNELLYTAVMTDGKIGGTDTTSSGSGENLLETPEENTDSAASDGTVEGETTDLTTEDANVEGDTSNVDVSNVEGETTTTDTTDNTDAALEGDTDSTNVDTNANEGEVIDASGDTGDMAIGGDTSLGGDMLGMDGMNGETTGSTIKDPFLSSYVPIAGISAATLVVGVIIGILLAKKKIKKGIDLYED